MNRQSNALNCDLSRIAKRVSLVLVGEPGACECGPSGTELDRKSIHQSLNQLINKNKNKSIHQLVKL